MRCPICLSKVRWRTGVGFEHEMICIRCFEVFEPGADRELLAEAQARYDQQEKEADKALREYEAQDHRSPLEKLCSLCDWYESVSDCKLEVRISSDSGDWEVEFGVEGWAYSLIVVRMPILSEAWDRAEKLLRKSHENDSKNSEGSCTS